MITDPNEIIKIPMMIFGEERVHLELKETNWKKDGDPFSIIIHFPEIEITNSRGQKHTIVDIYTKVVVQNINKENSFKASVELQGMRGTMTAKEIVCWMTHSHLPSSPNWAYFCLGSSQFAILKNNLQMSLTEENWMLYFLSIENYLKWESLEGTPYRSIGGLGWHHYSGRQVDIRDTFNKFRSEIPETVFGYTDRIVLISDSQELKDFYNQKSSVRSFNNITNATLEQICERYERDTKQYGFEFRGEMIYPKGILGETRKDEKSPVDKEVMEAFNQIIEEKLNQFNSNLAYAKLKRSKQESIFRSSVTF